MKARLQAWLEQLGDVFWLRPALVVLGCIALAQFAVWTERSAGQGTSGTSWGYSGGAQGARALLSAVAASAIGVATTIFSITITTLSLASGQMGPRLLRNFIRDSRNQLALGIFVGTFAYCLVVLRTVRTQDEGAFVPHAAVSGAIILAFGSIATIVWFVHHVVTSINIERVIDSVHGDLIRALQAGSTDEEQPQASGAAGGTAVFVESSGFLLAVDAERLADWAAANGAQMSLLIRPGDFLLKGTPVARVAPGVDIPADVLRSSLTFGRQQAAFQDIEYSIRQLAEIAVRALSPGINDPFTAGSVADRFGDALCRLAGRNLHSGVTVRDGRAVLRIPLPDYQGLCDAMFDTLRQNAATSPYVLIRLVDVFTQVVGIETDAGRRRVLQRHVAMVGETGRAITDPGGLAALRAREARFATALAEAPSR